MYRRQDSNLHCSAPKAVDSFRWSTAAYCAAGEIRTRTTAILSRLTLPLVYSSMRRVKESNPASFLNALDFQDRLPTTERHSPFFFLEFKDSETTGIEPVQILLWLRFSKPTRYHSGKFPITLKSSSPLSLIHL